FPRGNKKRDQNLAIPSRYPFFLVLCVLGALVVAIPLWEDGEQCQGGAGFRDATGYTKLWGIQEVRHRVARQAVAGIAFIAAARIGEGMVRQRDHVLEEQARGDEWLNRPKVPAVAFAVEVFEVEPAIAYVDGLDLHFRFGK